MAAELIETDEHDFSDVCFDEKMVVYLQALFRGALVRRQFREVRLLYNTIVTDTEENARMAVDWSRRFSPKVLHIRKLKEKNQLVCPAKNVDITDQPNTSENEPSLRPGNGVNSMTVCHDPMRESSIVDSCEKNSLPLDVEDDDVLLASQNSSITVAKTISEHVSRAHSPRTAVNLNSEHSDHCCQNLKEESHFNGETELYHNNGVSNAQLDAKSHTGIGHEDIGSDLHISQPEEMQRSEEVNTVVTDAVDFNTGADYTRVVDNNHISDDRTKSSDNYSYVQSLSDGNDFRSDDQIAEKLDDKTVGSDGQQLETGDNENTEFSTLPDMTSVWESCSSFKAPSLKSYPRDPKALQELRKSMAMELLWIQQAISSRKDYLRLKSQMNK